MVGMTEILRLQVTWKDKTTEIMLLGAQNEMGVYSSRMLYVYSLHLPSWFSPWMQD